MLTGQKKKKPTNGSVYRVAAQLKRLQKDFYYDDLHSKYFPLNIINMIDTSLVAQIAGRLLLT